jgi:tetratricopeptide (TPR) repeat protein
LAERARDEALWTEGFVAKLLQSADPWSGNESELTVRAALEKATERLVEDPPPSARAEAKVRATLGEIYNHLGAFDEAQVHLGRAVALREASPNDDIGETLRLKRVLLAAMLDADEIPEARASSEAWLEEHQRELGDGDAGTLAAMNLHADLLAAEGQWSAAEALYVQTLERRTQLLGLDHRGTMESASNLAVLFHNRGDRERAVPLLRDVLERRRRILGSDHPDTLLAIGNLATSLRLTDAFDEAEVLFREVVERKTEMLGPNHPGTILSRGDYGMLLFDLGRPDEAIGILRETVDSYEDALGREHRDTRAALGNLAFVLDKSGHDAEAERAHVDLIGRIDALTDLSPPGPILAVLNYARFLSARERDEEALAHFRRAGSMAEQGLPSSHPLLDEIGTELDHAIAKLEPPAATED